MSHYRDPAATPDATISSLVLMPETAADRARARLKVADMAAGVDDCAHLLDMLGIGNRAELAVQLAHRRAPAP